MTFLTLGRTMKIVMLLLFSLSVMVTQPQAQAHRSKGVRIEGCYQDTKLVADKTLVVGTGTITITKLKGGYTGKFHQLMNDSGESYAEVPLHRLIVNQASGAISFEVEVFTSWNARKLSKATGRITNEGLKLNWKEDAFQYGAANPFMKRAPCRKP